MREGRVKRKGSFAGTWLVKRKASFGTGLGQPRKERASEVVSVYTVLEDVGVPHQSEKTRLS